MNKAKALCVGDLLTDVWWTVDTAAKNVEHAAMALVSVPEDREITPGGVGLLATALAYLNQQPSVLSVADLTATTALVLQNLNIFHVDTQLVKHARRFVTPVKTRYVNENGHILMRHDYEEPNPQPGEIYTFDYVQDQLKNFDCLVISDYSKGCILPGVRRYLVPSSQTCGKPIYVDAKPAYLAQYAEADVIKINKAEFQNFAADLRDVSTERAIQIVAERLRTPLLIVTDGAAGAYYCHKFDTTCFMPNPARHVSGNCVGAGDVFFAGIIFGFAQLGKYRPAKMTENEIFKLLQFGLAAASEYVKRGYRQFPHSDDVLNAVYKRNMPVRRIMQPDDLIEFAAEQRIAGRQVVFTNGCFDLLHGGHVALLTAAKQEGDVLLVAVDADSNVTRLKGPGRPVQDENTRAGNIAALDVVDAVCVFEDSTDNQMLEYLITEAQPDVLVKGADYANTTVVGANFLSRQNPPGRVVLVPLIPNSSTTSFVNKIKAMTP